MELLLLWIVLSVAVAAFASSRGRTGIAFFFFSLVFSPLVGFVVALAVKNKAMERREQEERGRHAQLVNAVLQHQATGGEAATSEARVAVSVADELAKLAQLRSQGVLTNEEFETQKRRLLNAENQVR